MQLEVKYNGDVHYFAESMMPAEAIALLRSYRSQQAGNLTTFKNILLAAEDSYGRDFVDAAIMEYQNGRPDA